jgi:hypothetical protein
MVNLTDQEIEVIKGLEKLGRETPEELLFRFVILLLESGLMEPWRCAYNPCSEYRIT